MASGEGSPPREYKDYAISGKIMMGAMIVLFFVVIITVCLHLYTRWYLLRASRRQIRRRSRFVFSGDLRNAAPTAPSANRGLDAAVVKNLPIFAYSSKAYSEIIDCAVCLSEFGENEMGRILPRCKHSFHIECIDMWFHSHSTCPLCRTPVEEGRGPESSGEISVSVNEQSVINESGSSSGLYSDCEHELEYSVNRARPSSSRNTSSFGAQRKPLEMVGVSIEVPRRNDSFGMFDNESGCNKPASQCLKSPTSRMMSLSFKTILGRERRGGVSPSGNSVSFSPATASDIESGRDEIQRNE